MKLPIFPHLQNGVYPILWTTLKSKDRYPWLPLRGSCRRRRLMGNTAKLCCRLKADFEGTKNFLKICKFFQSHPCVLRSSKRIAISSKLGGSGFLLKDALLATVSFFKVILADDRFAAAKPPISHGFAVPASPEGKPSLGYEHYSQIHSALSSRKLMR